MKIRKKEQHESNVLLYIVLVAIVVIVGMMAALIASVSTHVDAQTQPPVQNDVTLTFIERDVAYRVFRHEQTGIYYLLGDTGVCVMLNADGTPYTGNK